MTNPVSKVQMNSAKLVSGASPGGGDSLARYRAANGNSEWPHYQQNQEYQICIFWGIAGLNMDPKHSFQNENCVKNVFRGVI